MRQKRKLPDYIVRLVGYSAHIIARKGNTEYAALDFVCGLAMLFVNDGILTAPWPSLSSAVADLSLCIDELKSLPDNDERRVERSGEVTISLNRGADVERFVGQIGRRYCAIEPILEPAEKLGSEIERRPHDDHINEIAKTGISRVVSHGVAFFVDGKLVYYPERHTALIDSRTLQVLEHWKG
jgi:hypothetical protein